jgi:hypothetical protein
MYPIDMQKRVLISLEDVGTKEKVGGWQLRDEGSSARRSVELLIPAQPEVESGIGCSDSAPSPKA